MKVVGFDPFLSAERAAELGIESVSPLDDLWGRCDYITLHTPLTAETRNLIGAAALAKMKPSVRIINCARGGLIDEPALAEALDAGKVAGAAIDVFDPEPPPADHPLVKHPQVLVTPHLGASTEEAQISVAVEAARLLVDFFQRGQIRFAVNMPTLDRAELDEHAALSRPGPPAGHAPRPDGPGDRQERHPPLPRRGGAQEHPADHRQLRRRLDGGRRSRSRSTSSTPRSWPRSAGSRSSRRRRPTPATSAR